MAGFVDKLKSADLFDSLKPEEKQGVRGLDVKMNPALEAILKNFEAVLEKGGKPTNLEDHVPEEPYTSKDVEAFSLAIAKYQTAKDFGQNAGIYLSALCNKCPDNAFIIHTAHISAPIEGIGISNRDNHLSVIGPVGAMPGLDMQSGRLDLYGDAKNGVGYGLVDGIIHLHGSATFQLGGMMEAGLILVDGNAGWETGIQMEGGTIRINGEEIGSIDKNLRGGNIYHKGKQIVKDGIKVK